MADVDSMNLARSSLVDSAKIFRVSIIYSRIDLTSFACLSTSISASWSFSSPWQAGRFFLLFLMSSTREMNKRWSTFRILGSSQMISMSYACLSIMTKRRYCDSMNLAGSRRDTSGSWVFTSRMSLMFMSCFSCGKSSFGERQLNASRPGTYEKIRSYADFLLRRDTL